MPRRKNPFDKKTAASFRLVHRAQNDPLIHDESASSMVFTELRNPNQDDEALYYQPAGSSAASQFSSTSQKSKVASRRDLDEEFGRSTRSNEGEAANHGIYYDDTEYDYMQHMRELGSSGGGEAYFLEAPTKGKKKGKQKVDLADALRAASLNDDDSRCSEAGISVSSSVASRAASDVFGADMAASEFVRKTTYQDQQNIPDAIAGFQPDMDPRLREVLEALEDEAYVDDEEDVFSALTEDPAELNQREWEDTDLWGAEDEGWESDHTIKAASPKLTPIRQDGDNGMPLSNRGPSILPAPDEVPAPAAESSLAYLEEFKRFKNASKASMKPADTPSDMQSSAMTGASALTSGGRKKKRKGALTSTSGYSMTSSALHRTEGLTLLDRRYDKIEEQYADEDFPGDFPDNVSMVSGMSQMSGLSRMSGNSNISETSEAPQLRSDFDSIMDDFLGTHSMAGKRRVRKGAPQTGLEQLDEVRKGLGPARFGQKKTARV